MLPELIDACTQIYPGVMAIVDRMLPTYAEHSARRAQEMEEAVRTIRAAGVMPGVTTAVLRMHEGLAEMNFNEVGLTEWTVESLIARLAHLAGSRTAAPAPSPFKGEGWGEGESC